MQPIDRAIRLGLTGLFLALSVYALVTKTWGLLVLALILTLVTGLAASGMSWAKAKAGPVSLETRFEQEEPAPGAEEARAVERARQVPESGPAEPRRRPSQPTRPESPGSEPG